MSFSTMAARINYLGGDSLGRTKKNKLWSFQRALKDSYQTRKIKTPNKSVWPCLINSSNLKSDYDRKIVSVEFASGLKAGETLANLSSGINGNSVSSFRNYSLSLYSRYRRYNILDLLSRANGN